MLKRSIVMGLLCVAGQAYSAEIAVTTTEDNDIDDTECSLREAIQYVNSGMPDEGYHGCGGEKASAVIVLEKQAVYKLNKRIEIKAGLILKTSYDTTQTGGQAAGLNNALIQMEGKDQIFHIDNNDSTLISVNINEVSLQGCKDTVCAAQGGLIYNNEKLLLQSVLMKDGQAEKGGAVYNVGHSDTAGLASTVQIYASLFENNKAVQGAAIYTLRPSLQISSSVFKDNTGPFAIYTENPLADASTLVFPYKKQGIVSSTFMKNSGFALNLKDGMSLNNITAVKNGGGIQFDVPTGQGYLANSIVLGNGAQNCSASADDKTVLYNNVLTAECPAAPAINNNTVWSGTDLIAGSDEGACKNLDEDQKSLLCPYVVPKDAFLGYLRPRVLLSYADVFAGPILNKGQSAANGNEQFIQCEGNDQRGSVRDADNLWCDRGAIEIVVPTSIPRAGQDIKTGEIARFNILEYLGDSDLIPKEQCNAVAGAHPNGEAWQDGCLLIKQTQTVSKGKTTLNLNGDLEYTPNSAWHGSDIFEIQVITTSTRFNTANKYISAQVHIKQEPDNDMESKTVATSGGAFGFYALTGLLGLIGLRRYKNKQGKA